MSWRQVRTKRDELGYKTQVGSPQCDVVTHVAHDTNGKMVPIRCRKKAINGQVAGLRCRFHKVGP